MKFERTPLDLAEGAILVHGVRAPGAVLKKGSVLTAEDVAALRAAGLEAVTAARLEAGDVREDDAASAAGSATLNGEVLYSDYQIHFMVTQGMRDRQTLRTSYPLEDKSSPAGAVNPALQQLEFYIRSPERHAENHPDREVFDHFFAM